MKGVLTSESVCVTAWAYVLINTVRAGGGGGPHTQASCYVSTSCVHRGAVEGWWKQHLVPEPDRASVLPWSSSVHVLFMQHRKKPKTRDLRSVLDLLVSELICPHVPIAGLRISKPQRESSKYFKAFQSRLPNPALLSGTLLTFTGKA